MVTAGGAMLGYWAIGRLKIATMPASMITAAITMANTGRRMKKADI